MSEQQRNASVELVVPYHDCDPAGVVWHGNYLRYFDEARCAFLDAIDYDYRTMEESGYLWPVIDAKLRYLKPVFYHEKVIVTCRLLEYEYRLRFAYEIRNSSNNVVTEGETVQVAVETATNEMCLGSPDVLLVRLGLTDD